MSDTKPTLRKAADSFNPESTRALLRNQKHYLIYLDEGREESDPKRVYVGVNGYAFWLQRGEQHVVPESIVKNLEESIETKFITRYDAENKPYMERRQVLAYPFRTIREATQEEIDEMRRKSAQAKAEAARVAA